MRKMDFGAIRTDDHLMKQVLCTAERVAPSRASVLIEGPSGTGKELLAQHIHKNSHRSSRRFMAVNCAAFPEGLLESELFGYEKGAFTGAYQRKAGKFELAEGGTFLLDEISEMPLALQAKILRVLQEGEVERLGGEESIKLNLRIISTSNKNLKQLVEDGKFREDLYYRLNVIRLALPALSSRHGDIRLLSTFFSEVSCIMNDRPVKTISEDAMRKLLSWNWPGNVRELENVVERAVLLGQGVRIEAGDIEIEGLSDAKKRTESLNAGMTLSEAEKCLILRTLEHTRNNRTQAARLLGISIRTLRNKLNIYKGAELV